MSFNGAHARKVNKGVLDKYSSRIGSYPKSLDIRKNVP